MIFNLATGLTLLVLRVKKYAAIRPQLVAKIHEALNALPGIIDPENIKNAVPGIIDQALNYWILLSFSMSAICCGLFYFFWTQVPGPPNFNSSDPPMGAVAIPVVLVIDFLFVFLVPTSVKQLVKQKIIASLTWGQWLLLPLVSVIAGVPGTGTLGDAILWVIDDNQGVCELAPIGCRIWAEGGVTCCCCKKQLPVGGRGAREEPLNQA